MSAPLVLTELADGVLTVTLNRPDKLNAIHNPLAEALLAAVEQARGDPDVRVLLLRGTGRAFCAGRDVSAPPTARDLELVQAVASALFTLPQPTVAAVHGWTVGAGFEWMLDTDLVVAAEGTKFRLPEASLGVFVTGGLTATLPAAVGSVRAKALMLLGEPFGAREARDWGLLWQVVPDGDQDAAAHALCTRLATLEPRVAASFKRVLNSTGLTQFEQAIALETEVQTMLDTPAGAD